MTTNAATERKVSKLEAKTERQQAVITKLKGTIAELKAKRSAKASSRRAAPRAAPKRPRKSTRSTQASASA